MNNFRDYTDFQPSVFTRTPEGYLTGKIRVTGAGVFSYMVADGQKIRRLRPLDQVGADDSIATLNSKPVTLRHPMEDVSPENAKKLQVGFTGTDASWDGLNAFVTLTITDADAIAACERGEVRAVSCGYRARLAYESGNWQGSAYDEVMTDIRYNHVALVREGRAGDGVRFRIGDCADVENFFKKTDGDKNMKKMILDGVEYEADEKIIDKLQATQRQLDESCEKAEKLVKENETITAARDAALAERDQLKTQLKDESEIARLVDEKVALLDSAKSFGIEVKAVDSIKEIKKAFVKKAFPKMDLENKSPDYVMAAYDMACESLKESAEKKPSSLAPNFAGMKDAADPEKAYQDMCDRRFNKKKKEA